MAQLSIHHANRKGARVISQVDGFAVGAAGTLPRAVRAIKQTGDDIYPHKGKTNSWHVV